MKAPKIGIVTLWLLFWAISLCANSFIGNQTNWKGYTRINFEVESRMAWATLPEDPVAGNPWVWRSRFPDWHSEMDELLLQKGVAIAYIDVSNLYGAPEAVRIWDAFYGYMLAHGMHAKPALEGVSRGGLICLNWAKENPEKVSCIYLEAPVCDLKSWPGGQGKGKGSIDDWEQAKTAYGLDEKGLLEWNDNPLENLQGLAAEKVPIFASIGLDDMIVPPSENILNLASKYISLGGPITIYPMTKGETKLDGHHFDIECPELIAEFMLWNLFQSIPGK